jgi:hypothetical protein
MKVTKEAPGNEQVLKNKPFSLTKEAVQSFLEEGAANEQIKEIYKEAVRLTEVIMRYIRRHYEDVDFSQHKPLKSTDQNTEERIETKLQSNRFKSDFGYIQIVKLAKMSTNKGGSEQTIYSLALNLVKQRLWVKYPDIEKGFVDQIVEATRKYLLLDSQTPNITVQQAIKQALLAPVESSTVYANDMSNGDGEPIPWLTSPETIRISPESISQLEVIGGEWFNLQDTIAKLYKTDSEFRGVADTVLGSGVSEDTAFFADSKGSLVITRPDFAIQQGEGGEISFVATEFESAPGGLGMAIIMTMIEELKYNPDFSYGDLLKINIPHLEYIANLVRNNGSNKFIVLMSQDWGEYATELKVFCKLMQDKHDISSEVIDVDTVSDSLTQNPDSSQPTFEGATIFNFGYSWNLRKTEDAHKSYILLHPEVAVTSGLQFRSGVEYSSLVEFLGISENSKMQDSVLNLISSRGLNPKQVSDLELWCQSVNQEFITRNSNKLVNLIKYLLKSNLDFTNDFSLEYAQSLCGILLYEDTSGNEFQANVNARKKTQDELVKTSQSSCNLAFNDLATSRLLCDKAGISLATIPSTRAKLAEAGVDVESCQRFNPETIPLLTSEQISTLPNQDTDYINQKIGHIINNPELYILKVARDDTFGYLDWGARGIIKGPDYTKGKKKNQWVEIVRRCCESGKFIAQEIVDNRVYTEIATEKQVKASKGEELKHPIEDGKQQVLPTEELGVYKLGDSRVRVTPFMFKNSTYPGLYTFTPCNSKDFSTAHSTGHSVMGTISLAD